MTNTKKKTTKKKPAALIVSYKGVVWTARDILGSCPHCGARALTALPAPLLAQQPDDTTIVCNPGFGGCNQGFAV